MVNLNELKHEARELTRWEKHRFMFMVAGVITISLILVTISMNLYNSNGAAQVDLSRPGFQSVRDQVSRDETSETYPSSGPLDREALDKFEQLYQERSAMVLDVSGFGSDALSDDSLGTFYKTTAEN